MFDLSNICQLIKDERKKKGWSQQELAVMANLDRTTIGSIERNAYSDIGIRKIQRILALFNKTLVVADKGLPTLDDLIKERATE